MYLELSARQTGKTERLVKDVIKTINHIINTKSTLDIIKRLKAGILIVTNNKDSQKDIKIRLGSFYSAYVAFATYQEFKDTFYKTNYAKRYFNEFCFSGLYSFINYNDIIVGEDDFDYGDYFSSTPNHAYDDMEQLKKYGPQLYYIITKMRYYSQYPIAHYEYSQQDKFKEIAFKISKQHFITEYLGEFIISPAVEAKYKKLKESFESQQIKSQYAYVVETKKEDGVWYFVEFDKYENCIITDKLRCAAFMLYEEAKAVKTQMRDNYNYKNLDVRKIKLSME